MKEIGSVQYSKDTYSDVNMLLNFEVIDPVTLNKNLTWLWGKNDNRYPLLSLTEGNGITTSKKPLNPGDSQYKWKVAGKMRVTSQIVRLVSSVSSVGGYNEFEVEMKDNFFIYQWGAITPDGQHLVRIQSEGKPTSNNTYLYRMVLQAGGANAVIDPSNFQTGKSWGIAAPTIPSSKSDGNRSNTQTYSEATNQFSWYRFSDQIAGNISNKVIDFEFDTEDGGKTNLWMPFEMKQFETKRRMVLEDELWFSEYNRDANGVIHLKDPENEEPIPKGNGVKATLKAVNNFDTFAKLTLERIDNTITRIFDNRLDTTPVEIVLYCGTGFAREFSRCMENDAKSKGYLMALGESQIKNGTDGYLTYGSYFNQYRTIDGKIITVKVSDMFNNGVRAEMDRANGRMYKGLPYSSYTACFLDHSMNDGGERNIQLVYEDGREYQVGIYRGMATIPAVWKAYKSLDIATRKDIATYEVISSQGLAMLNPTTSFWMELAA